MTTGALPSSARVIAQIKRFFGGPAAPSPLAWVIVGGLSFTVTKLLAREWFSLLYLVPGIYALLFGLPKAVAELKKRAVDSAPSAEYRLWAGLQRRFVQNNNQGQRVSAISFFSQLSMLIPTLIEGITKATAPTWLILGCGVGVTLGLCVQTVLLWYLTRK